MSTAWRRSSYAYRRSPLTPSCTVSHRAGCSGCGSRPPRGRLRIEVRDSGPGRPTAQSPRADSENGRGLLLVGELADAWGNVEHTVGKTVWFAVKATQTQGRAQ